MEWIRALELWQPQNMGEHGCTFPYLVGMKTVGSNFHKPEAPTTSDVTEILNYVFNNTNAPECYFLRFCPDIKWVILEKANSSYEEFIDYGSVWRGSHKVDGKSLLLVEKQIIRLYGETDEEIIKNISNESNKRIELGDFSRCKCKGVYTWGPYCKEDIDFISKVYEKSSNLPTTRI